MITVIMNRPNRTIDIISYGTDTYTDKDGKKIHKVYGIISPSKKGRLVSRDSEVIKDFYIDENAITIFRSDNLNDVLDCKTAMDYSVSRGMPIFNVERFKEILANAKEQERLAKESAPVEAEVISDAN